MKIIKVSIVIPFFNKWELTHQLLYDIYNQCRDVDDVVVVNNGSTEDHGLSWWQDTKMLPLRVVSVVPNKGFLLGSNAGLQAALGDVVALISNDVRIKGNLTGILRSSFTINPNILMGGKVYHGDTGWNNFNGRLFPYAEGWLLATGADTWKKLGYFDPRYVPNDFEDVDLSTSALQSGIQLVELPAGLAEHMGAQTLQYSPSRESLTKINREKFKQKWIS